MNISFLAQLFHFVVNFTRTKCSLCNSLYAYNQIIFLSIVQKHFEFPFCDLHSICFFVVFVFVAWQIWKEGLWFCVLLFSKSALGSLLWWIRKHQLCLLLNESKDINYVFLLDKSWSINFILLLNELGGINIGNHWLNLAVQWIYENLQHCCLMH